MSWYLTIRSDSEYSQFTASTPLVEFLKAVPELRQTDPVSFESAIGSPWIIVTLAKCNSNGSYNSTGEFLSQVNVVELICSQHEVSSWYDALACRIAAFLGWSAFEDHASRQVWPSNEHTT